MAGCAPEYYYNLEGILGDKGGEVVDGDKLGIGERTRVEAAGGDFIQSQRAFLMLAIEQ